MTEIAVDREINAEDPKRELANLLFEDRNGMITLAEAKKWVSQYVYFLEKLKNNELILRQKDFGDWEITNAYAKLWINEFLLKKGQASILVGKPRIGKSHFVSWLILRTLILHPNWNIYTNIPYYFFDEKFKDFALPHVYNVSTLSEILRNSASSVLNNRVPAVIIDEMDQAITSQEFQKAEYASFSTLLNILGHLMIQGPLLVYHSINDVPKPLRRGFISNRILLITMHDGYRYVFGPNTAPDLLKVTGFVPPYSTIGINGFEIDVDVKALEKKIQSYSKYDVARQILDNIDKCMLKTKKEEEGSELIPKIEHDIIQLRKLGYTYEEIVNRLNTSSATIRKVIKKYNLDGGRRRLKI